MFIQASIVVLRNDDYGERKVIDRGEGQYLYYLYSISLVCFGLFAILGNLQGQHCGRINSSLLG